MRIERLVLRYEITQAQLLCKTTPAEMTISVKREEMKMDRDPLQLEVDNRAFYDSIGIKSLRSQAQQMIQKGEKAALDKAGQYSNEKNAMMGPDALNPAQIAAQRGKEPVKTVLAFLPEEKPDMSWSGGHMDLQIPKDKVEISWQPPQIEYTYVPYSIEYFIERV